VNPEARVNALAAISGTAISFDQTVNASTTDPENIPFAMSILPFSVAATSQLFAAVRDDLNQDPQGRSKRVVAIIRMAFTAGWIVGSVVGTWLADTASLRVTLWLTALCFLAQIIPVGNLKSRKVRPSETPFPETSALPPSRLRAMRPLLLFTGFFVLVYAGESVKYGFLPLYTRLLLRFYVRTASVLNPRPFLISFVAIQCNYVS
jgi:MFS transporter, SET family, sugar efflux transporter